MSRNEILQQYYNIVGTDSAKARQLIKKLDYKEDAYLLACIAQTYYDETIFNQDGSYRVYFNARKRRLAEKYAIKAFELNPDSAEVLYVLGKIRNAFKQTDLAIYCFKRIIELGVKSIVRNEGESLRYAKMKVNDSKFQLYRLYHDKGNITLSQRYLTMYKNGLRKGIKTIYKPLKKFLMN